MTSYQEAISRHFRGINDSTLREGEQYNGSVFSLADQQQILRWLHLVNVNTAEVGNPIVEEINRDLQILTKESERPPLMAHIRNLESDLAAALALGSGLAGVHLLCTADPERLSLLGVSLEEHIEELAKNVRQAQTHGLVVRVSVEHGLEERFFPAALQILKVADSLGVDRVQVADTRGVLLPWDVTHLIGALRQEIRPETEIGVHVHNDLGHATSNAVTALAAGANWVDTTLLGVGERTGITALSALLVNLRAIDPRLVESYSLSLLTSIEGQMAELLGLAVPHNLITSPTAFSHKAGIHLNGIRKQGAQIYEAFDPSVVGNQRVVVTDSRISGKRGREKVEVNPQKD